MLGKLVQLLKAYSPMEVTLEGISIPDKLVHNTKALLSIAVTLFGIVTLVRPLQPEYLLLVDYQYYTL